MTYHGPERPIYREPRRTVRRGELLGLIEANGGSEHLDLREVFLLGDGPSPWPWENPIDLSPEAVTKEHAIRCGGRGNAPWLSQHGTMCLTRARLQGAVLNRANLEQSNLIEAELELAYIGEAKLQNALLQRAQLREASLDKTDLRGAQLSWADLEHADLGKAQLQGTSLYEARLQDANLRGAQMQSASLYGAQL